MKELENFIKNGITQDGSWYSDGYEVFIKYAKILYEKGIGVDFIKGMLVDLYSAVSNEYGN